MEQKCLLISFDFRKPEYSEISYSVATILAKFKDNNNLCIEPCSYNLNEFSHLPKVEVKREIVNKFKVKYMNCIENYAFIAIAAYAWSENITNAIISTIRSKFNGKIILGGYEITAWGKESLLEKYPDADFYIKGYAEKALENIFSEKSFNKIVYETVNADDLISPYLTKAIPLDAKKIHWESKRGCPYKCDYCEHGAANREDKNPMIRIKKERIEDEMKLFRQSKIQEINVLDPTFLINEQDIQTLESLLLVPNCRITLQMHFSCIEGALGSSFLDLCEKHKERIHLEFGLQTIHKQEMKILKRINNIPHVKKVMSQLNERHINYEMSIIFGIPHQTVDSYKETINFIEENGCKNFCAFPLQLPKNSNMRKQMENLKIREFEGEHTSLSFVSECCSFTHEEWKEMYRITQEYTHHAPFCGDPVDALQSVSERIISSYLRGGVHGTFEKGSKTHSIFF